MQQAEHAPRWQAGGAARLASGIVHATGMLLHSHGTPSYHHRHGRYCVTVHGVIESKNPEGGGKEIRERETEAVAMSYSGACSTILTLASWSCC